ncbi:MAG: hypothetical protein DRI36_00925 [Caldiserica bacterium]|nr:MAG: hypothetical protein DRI36_00925 [Caldisericota bacterium]
MEWVRSCWEPGEPQIPYSWDALDILNKARNGERMYCVQYVLLFVQSANALGIPARYLGLFNCQGEGVHAVSEAWSNDFKKWVFIDVLNRSYFQDQKGVPLSAIELRDRIFNKQKIKIIGEIKDKESYYRMFRNLVYCFRNDYLEQENSWIFHPQFSVLYFDKNACPLKRFPLITDDKNDLEFPVNHINIIPYQLIKRKYLLGKEQFYLILKIERSFIIPPYDIEVKIDKSRWRKVSDDSFEIKLKKGINRIFARIDNKSGQKLLAGRLSMDFSPP